MEPMMKRFRSIFFLLIAIGFLSACRSESGQSNYEPNLKYTPYVQSLTAVNPQDYLYLFDYDNQAPLDIQGTKQWQENGATWIDLSYASPHGGRVPATLVIPPGKGPFAAVILMHGMPSDRQSLAPLAGLYANFHAVALLIDAPFNRPEYAKRKWVDGNPLDFTGQDRQDQIQLIVDLRRGVDLLASHPKVDPARLAYIGGSYGGAMGGLLAGVEHRLKAYVLVVGDGGLVSHLTGFDDANSYPLGTFFRLPMESRQAWVDLMWPIEPINYVGQATPAALLFQNGTRDGSVLPADAVRFQQAGSQPKKTLWYNFTHNMMGERQVLEDQLEFLQDHIGVGTLVIRPGFGPNYLWLDRAFLAWALLALISLGWVVWDVIKNLHLPLGARLFWISLVLLAGPLGLLIYLLVRRNRIMGSWQAVLVEAAGSVTPTILAYLVILFLIILVPAFQSNYFLQILLVFALPLLLGSVFFQGWLLAPVIHKGYLRTLLQRFPHAWVAANVGIGGMVIVSPLVNWFFRTYGFMTLFSWAMVAIFMLVAAGALVAILLLSLYEGWAVQRGFRAWGVLMAGEGEVITPSWRKLWWWILLSFTVPLGGVFASMWLTRLISS